MNHHLPLALALAASSCAAILLAGALMFRLCLRRPAVDDDDAERVGPEPGGELPIVVDNGKSRKVVRRLKWEEVEALTGNFTAGVIGEGGFSTVYLGRLPADSADAMAAAALAAFKVQHSSERLYRAFLQERDVLLRVRHPNIVELNGYCDDHDEGVLVFEYVPNGTLHEKLHPNVGELAPSSPLRWARRATILYQIASAVDYLHDGSDDLHVVHGDLTASNVLLDADLNPKLCDFGSARAGFSAAVKAAAAGHVVGSPGYADPHYLRTGILTKKSDVYSFGVLVLETISGIPAVGFGQGRTLAAEMRERGWGNVTVDPRMGTDFDAGEVGLMGELAGRCVGEQPGTRPAMGEIVKIMREKVKLCNL